MQVLLRRNAALCAALVVGAVLVFGAGRANAGLFEDDEARRAVLDLRAQVTELRGQAAELRKQQETQQRAYESGQFNLSEELRRSTEENAQLRRGMLELQNQMESLRADLAKSRGQQELLAREVAEMQRQTKDAAVLLDERMRKLEPVKVAVDGREFLAEPAEKRDYEQALAVFRKGDFERAQVALVDFLNRYGAGSGYRVSALFWLGNAQYALKDYKEAIINFRSLIAVAPDHVRVPESLLAISNCQLEMKDNKAARKTLEELLKAHPGTEAGAAAKERLARLK
ncbi:MAG: tetratricopeptide repeat protein [Rhodoferax sp.]